MKDRMRPMKTIKMVPLRTSTSPMKPPGAAPKQQKPAKGANKGRGTNAANG